MSEISLRSVERLLKKSGCQRIGVDAVKELQVFLEDEALKLGKRASILSKHAKRRTVMGEDVKLAIKNQ